MCSQWRINEQRGCDLAPTWSQGAPREPVTSPATRRVLWLLAVPQPLQRGPGQQAPRALLSLRHRLRLLGCFQPRQYLVPLNKLLGEEQGLGMALKERDVETAWKKPRPEHPKSPNHSYSPRSLGKEVAQGTRT